MTHTHLGATAGVDHDHAGQGPVLLDIGDDVGALIVSMPANLASAEVELRPHGDSGRGPEHHPHVGVVAHHICDRVIHSAVFAAVPQGRYELYLRPDGPVQLHATVRGGHITELHWPAT